MAVMAREEWTDKHLDDLSKRVDEGNDRRAVQHRYLDDELAVFLHHHAVDF